MNPEELANELEKQDYDYWLDIMLDKVPNDIDKREGSIIFDAVAPAAMACAQQSLSLANIIKETYIITANGEFLDYRATEHGATRYPATYAEVSAVFQDDDGNPIDTVHVGDRFASIGESPFFYTVTKINPDLTALMQAEESGTAPNAYLGQILPVTPNDELGWAEIKEVTAPARDEETDDHLRHRLLNSFAWTAYGGNVADYLDMVSKISEIGAAQVYPTWHGPGTVKLVILNNELMPASKTLIKEAKEKIDPEDKETEGYGLAPIDHRVTVTTAEILKVNIQVNALLDAQYIAANIERQIKDVLAKFFADLRENWSTINPTTGRGYTLTIFRSRILSKIMQIEGVANANLPILNGNDSDISLVFNNDISQLPVLGEVKVINENR